MKMQDIKEVATTSVNIGIAEDIKMISKMLNRGADMFYQNNSIAGKAQVKKAIAALETMSIRLRNLG